MKQMLSITAYNQPDMLVRITGMLYRRGFFVERLNAVPTCQNDYTQIDAIIDSYRETPEHSLHYQLEKLLGVVNVRLIQSE